MSDYFNYEYIRSCLPHEFIEKFNPVFAAEINPRKVKKVWVIEGMNAEQEASTISGLPGSGKSVIETDKACRIAAGMPVDGRAARQGWVIYFAGERRELTERRVEAFKREHGLKHIPLIVLDGRLSLATPKNGDADRLADGIRALEEATEMDCVYRREEEQRQNCAYGKSPTAQLPSLRSFFPALLGQAGRFGL